MDPLAPSSSVLAKLGSIAVHVREAMGPHGHPLDRSAVEALLDDPELQDWLKQMRELAMLPEPRA